MYLTLAEGAVLTAPEGKVLKMTVNGADFPVVSGEYKGLVVLSAEER